MSNTPKLRFKEFNDDWHKNKLNKFLYEHKERNYDNKYTKIDVLSVSGEKGIINQIEYMGRSFAGKEVDNYHIVHHGDIVYTKSPLKSNPYGIIKVNKQELGIVSTLYAVYSCKDNIDGIFLDYYFQLDDNVNKYLRPLVNKGAKNDMKIKNEHVLTGYISTPSLPEQEKIASFLSLYDKKIELQEKKVDSLKEYKKGMMQKMFSQELRFKDENGENYPEWEEKRLKEVCYIQGGHAFKSTDFKKSGTPIIRISNIDEVVTIEESNVVYTQLENIDSKFCLKKGDLLIAMSGATTGKTGIYRLEDYAYLNQRVGLFVNKDNSVLHYDFLYCLVNTNSFHQQLKSSLVAGAQPNISPVDIELMKFKFPSLPEQEKIASLLSTIDKKIELEEKKLEELKEYKKGLLQQMFI